MMSKSNFGIFRFWSLLSQIWQSPYQIFAVVVVTKYQLYPIFGWFTGDIHSKGTFPFECQKLFINCEIFAGSVHFFTVPYENIPNCSNRSKWVCFLPIISCGGIIKPQARY